MTVWSMRRVVGALAVVAGFALAQEPLTQDPQTPKQANVISLADSIEPFLAQFNADSQELRFLAVLSPS